uniref:Uncharacterized protein n=1 Tax=Pyxicephalus adspersus TaxID=30357 RepID=A0AAV3AGS1_PYXAD|nr:TPA: hypothetical protein GDO54_012154 [Pyxicephalus adspersus]
MWVHSIQQCWKGLNHLKSKIFEIITVSSTNIFAWHFFSGRLVTQSRKKKTASVVQSALERSSKQGWKGT